MPLNENRNPLLYSSHKYDYKIFKKRNTNHFNYIFRYIQEKELAIQKIASYTNENIEYG